MGDQLTVEGELLELRLCRSGLPPGFALAVRLMYEALRSELPQEADDDREQRENGGVQPDARSVH